MTVIANQGDGLVDWQIGDLAVCIEGGDWFSFEKQDFDGIGPELGSVHKVTFVSIQHGGVALDFAEWPDEWFWADAFRKIRPDEHEACEPEFVTLIKRAKRPVSA